MKQERVQIAVGIFILFAFLIALITGITLYNQYLQGKIEYYVMFFKGSLNGLEAGSPVLYRGVKIGKVDRIELTANKAQTNVAIPVYVNFFVEKSFVQRNNPIKILIGNGIVAKISSPSLFTDKSTIRLVPSTKNEEISRKTTTYHGYIRFPTQSIIEERTSLNSALKTAETTFKDFSAFIHSKNITEMIASFTKMANNVGNFSTEVKAKKVSEMVANFTKMADSVKIFANDFNAELPSAVANFNEGLKNFSGAAESTKNLADYLARHPESLLRGKS